jgi:hypothetical protein
VERVVDQDSEFLRFIEERQLMPGSEITIRNRDLAADSLEVRSATGTSTAVGLRAASKVLVSLKT